jgi:hypothetical protein
VKFDWKQIAMLVLFPAAIGAFDYLAQDQAPFSKITLSHAAMMFVVVALSLAKQSFLPDNRKPEAKP